MFCKKCEKEIEEEWASCPYCGTVLESQENEEKKHPYFENGGLGYWLFFLSAVS